MPYANQWSFNYVKKTNETNCNISFRYDVSLCTVSIYPHDKEKDFIYLSIFAKK